MDLNLVVVDGSAVANKAARLAVQIAQLEHHRLLGLYIVDEALVLDSYANYHKELGSNDQPDSRAELIEWFEAVGHNALEQLRQSCERADIPVETQILFGGVPELILDHAIKAQLLTLGRRGRGHASNPSHLGSYFCHIAHHARIPLLVGGDIAAPITNLLLLCDGNPHLGNALDWTVKLQHDFAAIVNVTIMDRNNSESISQDMKEQMLKHGLIDYHFVPLHQENINGVMEAIVQSEADLLLVGGYRHPEILEWLVGGRIDQILRKTPLPVLIA